MSKVLNGLRVSAMSVHEGWWYTYLAAFFIQMAGWTLMIGWDEATYGGHARTIEYIRAVGTGSSQMAQIFILSAIGAVEIGRLTMILAQGIADRMKERRERFKEELIAQGKAEGMAEGIARGLSEGMAKGVTEGETKGRAKLAAEVAAWNRRRLDAEARGEKFDEPPPMN